MRRQPLDDHNVEVPSKKDTSRNSTLLSKNKDRIKCTFEYTTKRVQQKQQPNHRVHFQRVLLLGTTAQEAKEPY
jgi:hypothetical protein